MRIGIVAHLKYAICEPFAGGLEMHTHMLAAKLRERGHKVTLFASTRSDRALGIEAICDETSLLETGIAEANDVAFFREHHAYLRLMNDLRRRDFDIIHNNSLHYLPVSLADTLDMPFLTTLHTPPFCWLESGIRLCRAPWARFVAVSKSTAALWSHAAPVDRVVANGIDLAHFPFRALPDDEPYLVWYGRIVPEKGLEFAIDAARIAGLPLRFAGPVPDRAYFESAIAPRLGSGVDYLGHLDHRALSGLIGGARAALCTPRWEEPFGLVVAEALSCGTPVAAFGRGGVREMLDARCGALAATDDAQGLARAIGVAIGLSRAECRAHAQERCDADAMIDAYEALYSEMVAARLAARSEDRSDEPITIMGAA